MEKFVNFTCSIDGSDWVLDFKDSLAFLSAPLGKLAKNLKSKVYIYIMLYFFKVFSLHQCSFYSLNLNPGTWQIVKKFTSKRLLISSRQISHTFLTVNLNYFSEKGSFPTAILGNMKFSKKQNCRHEIISSMIFYKNTSAGKIMTML